MKIYYPAGDRTPDLLNQTQTCYHLSQHGKLHIDSNENKITEVGKNEIDINSLRHLTKEIQYQVSKKVHMNQKDYDYLMPRVMEINCLINTVLSRTEVLESQNAQLLAAFSKMCVCFPKPTHCTIMHFGFCARQIDGFECGLFSNHAPLGQTTLRVG